VPTLHPEVLEDWDTLKTEKERHRRQCLRMAQISHMRRYLLGTQRSSWLRHCATYRVRFPKGWF